MWRWRRRRKAPVIPLATWRGEPAVTITVRGDTLRDLERLADHLGEADLSVVTVRAWRCLAQKTGLPKEDRP